MGYSLNDPRPEGQPGPEADALARSMEAAVDKEAWDRTGAVRWSFFEQHHYVWDRERDLVELRWGDSRALFRTAIKPAASGATAPSKRAPTPRKRCARRTRTGSTTRSGSTRS